MNEFNQNELELKSVGFSSSATRNANKYNRKAIPFFCLFALVFMLLGGLLVSTTYSAFQSKATSTGALTFAVTGSPLTELNLHFNSGAKNDAYLGLGTNAKITGTDNILKLVIQDTSSVMLEFDFNNTAMQYDNTNTIKSSDNVILNYDYDSTNNLIRFTSASEISQGSYILLDSIISQIYATQDIVDITAYTLTATASKSGSASSKATIKGNYTASIVFYAVNNEFTNIISTGATYVEKGQNYTATLTAESGYKLPESITIKIGGTTINTFTYDSSTGVVTIPASSISGNVQIIAEAINIYVVTVITSNLDEFDSIWLYNTFCEINGTTIIEVTVGEEPWFDCELGGTMVYTIKDASGIDIDKEVVEENNFWATYNHYETHVQFTMPASDVIITVTGNCVAHTIEHGGLPNSGILYMVSRTQPTDTTNASTLANASSITITAYKNALWIYLPKVGGTVAWASEENSSVAITKETWISFADLDKNGDMLLQLYLTDYPW